MSNDEKINWNDPLFLVSRSIDGDLSASEQVRLDEVLAASAELGLDAEKLRRVAGLVESRRAAAAQIDWEIHGQLILAQISEEKLDLAGVDSVLQQWSARTPQYDERDLARNVMAQIAPARQRRRSAWRATLRLGAPLAAAAAVALAVTATWFAPATKSSMMAVTIVQIGPPEDFGRPSSETIVSFAKPAASVVDANESLSFGYMTLGSSPNGQFEESPL
jgi:hypothetical protein